VFFKKALNIKNHVLILIATFLFSSFVTEFIWMRTFEKNKVNGPLYLDIKESKDLKVDIFPPKIYIVETYLFVQQLLSEKDKKTIEKRMEDIDRSRNEYLSYYAYWEKRIKDTTVRRLLMEESHSYVEAFFEIYDTKFLPAFYIDEIRDLEKIVNEDMKALFSMHRIKIEEASILIEEASVLFEMQADKTVERSRSIMQYLYGLFFFFVMFISIVIFKKVKSLEERIIQSQKESEMANKNLKNIITGLRRFKHNFDNTLASVKGYLIKNDVVSLNEYLDEIIMEKNQIELNNYIKLEKLQDSALSGLILAKIVQAEKLNIDFSLTIQDGVKIVDMKISHLCEVLGILLDNALEASLDSRQKKIKVLLYSTTEQICFEIANTFEILPQPSRLFEKGWSSKGEHRGLGLWILNNIISKYENVLLNTFIEQDFFKQELILSKK
jgi:signal transduction histidine kinase